MATRCATEVTVVDQTDATAVRCWYQLSASATLPAKPTTADASATPSGWTRSEPTISSAADAAKYVYACWQTVWGDGTCDWGDVSMSASFEAAKTAYNLASSANATATTTQQNLDDLQIGGRNLFVSSLASKGYPADKAVGTQYAITGMSANHEAHQLVPVEEGASYVFQYWVDNSEHQGWICIQLLDSEGIVVSKLNRTYPNADYWMRTFTVPAGVATALISGRHLAAGYEYAKLKLEKGTKPTDWTPAPEDTDVSIAAVQDNLNATRAWYAECPTAAGTAAKVATITPVTTDFALVEGVTVAVKFTYANGVASPTLNVNGTGAKDIKRYGTTAPSTSAASSWNAGNVVTLVYDGTYWQMANWLNNYDNYYDRENYKAALAASTAIAAGRIAAMGSDNKLKILAENSAFDISGPILYVATAYSAANVTAAATRATNYTFWGTPFALTNTHAITGAAAGKPVYIVGTLSGNMFTPSNDVFTCTTPTSADNLVYMRLGIMSTAANAVLESQHPLYMYFNGAFQQCDKSTADAAKTATNYIGIDTDGIKIADANPSSATTYLHLASSFLDFIRGGASMLKAWLDGPVAKVRVGAESGFNTLTDNEGIKLMNGTTVLSQFATNLIELGCNSMNAVINLCGGKGSISYTTATSSNTGRVNVYGDGGVDIYADMTSLDGTSSAFARVNASGTIVNQDGIEAGVSIIANSGYDVASIDVEGGYSSESGQIASNSYIYASATEIRLSTPDVLTAYITCQMTDFINAIPVTLYDNASASASATATLSETAANFKRLTIFFKDTDGNYSSTEVWSPNGKRVALSLTWINGASTQDMYQRVRWVTISGTTISTYKASSDSKYRTGQVKLGATASVTNSDYISIVHVIGYR